MKIKYNEICATDIIFKDIAACKMNTDYASVYDYEMLGRTKNLLFYQLENRRKYYLKDKHICTLKSGDILFLPHGVKYRSFDEDSQKPAGGIGISFNMFSTSGEVIRLDEDIKLLTNDSDRQYYKQIKRILYSVMNPAENVLRLKGEMYTLLDELFSNVKKRENFDSSFSDIIKAIRLLENSPEKNVSVKELADMCHISESSFLRKFKEYSGGVSPIKYRNNIRIMLAEELAASNLTISEIADKTGFYDAAHLCKAYKNAKGVTIKNSTPKLNISKIIRYARRKFINTKTIYP